LYLQEPKKIKEYEKGNLRRCICIYIIYKG
jgi:hypothetical protein